MSEPRKIAFANWTSMRTGLVSLARDWKMRRLPPLCWGEERTPLADIRPATPMLFAERSGYYMREGMITFVMQGDRFPQYDWKKSGLFVSGEFNNWVAVGKRLWQLEPALINHKEYYLLTVPVERCIKKGIPATFKFTTGRGDWLELPGDAPNTVTDAQGNRNLQIQPNCGGLHQFLFTTPQSMNEAGQGVIHWVERDYTESALLHPGRFLLDLKTDLPLGAVVDAQGTTFRLFAPRATAVSVSIFLPRQAAQETRLPMALEDEVTWMVKHPANLDGHHYYYQVEGAATCQFSGFNSDFRILDPWALAAAGPEGPGIVVDKRKYEKVRHHATPMWQDLVIMETHVRDLSALAPVSMTADERLGFTGLKKWVESEHFYPHTLGINAVELQPIQQFDSKSRWDYAWGYMPVNYFAPCSHYSLRPDTASGVAEFRELVDVFHRRGMSVILDVVYNHVGEPNHLHQIDKYYWFELAQDGSYMNWSGCGNDLRCGTPMAKRLLIDSLLHLMEFYGVDGFRFDLAELIGLDTLKEVEKALKKVRPSVILIAEPWSFRGHLGLALKQTGFASWNDGYRDFVASYVRGLGNTEGLRYFLAGSLGHLSAWPAQTVNYVASHDDYGWLDRITENPNNNGLYPTPNDRRRTHLMVAILFMSIGMPMLAAGQDMLHSKQGFHNTYLRGDLNALDYKRASQFPGTHDYFRRWIKFRRGEKGKLLRLFSPPSQSYFQYFYSASGSSLAVLYNADFSHGHARLLFAVNPHPESVRITLGGIDLGKLKQIADAERFELAGLVGALVPFEGDSVELPPLSCALWLE
ncbi:MAG: alpha-amylase family glycosyl hydrolase [Verrucomicrobiota bacterium]|nr:alpha-amylase family glycosyl hydrolase [Verrucomicrobiota bacterium]